MGFTFKNLTRQRAIGANSYLISNGKQRFVLDAGSNPKDKGHESLPNYAAVTPDSLDAIILTHAHHDHIGSLPVLQRMQPKTPVYMTEPTGEVGAGMLHNSVNVMTSQREELGIQEYPLFTHREIDGIKAQWFYRDLRHPFVVPDTDVECTFFDAGHIMGSVGVLMKQGGKSLFYTGDVNFEDQTITRAADFPTEPVDVLVMETTRGDYVRPEGFTRRAEKERLAKVIRETFERDGAVLMPVFALGKSQELLVMLHELWRMELIPKVPVLIGGLSAKVTVEYDRYASKTRRNYEGFQIFEDMDMLVAPRRRKKELSCSPHTIYALSSGMMSEGTVSNKFARGFLDNPRNTVAFVGYTDGATPGWRVRNGKPGEMISLDATLPEVQLNCRVESFDFSAHAPREDLVEYARKLQPKKILLVHGDEPAQDWFASALKAAMPECEVILPDPGKEIELW
ncbi:MBL fold metallo-hydrolase [Phragmitibacter flavus]|uniref:MBL fold metallo-hydrolase n=1 Tax=Phragmitibacter flavus TaxID=2576071 RepID=A0A5R8KAG4_9BACT|nr:MBL fold metallo-hydrolase RNA specificity domain-containing protein [Phragmitibacter flavus]TLD69303.1 MBL fold metallo-hydrolase [Phragmitibacter flavus]